MDKKEEKYTWDLTHLYSKIENWHKDVEETKKLAETIVSKRNTITQSAKNLLETLTLNDQLGIKLTKVYVYAKMFFDQDMKNSQAKELYEIADALSTKVSDQLAFLEPELLKLNEATYQKFAKIQPELKTYNHMFEKLFKKKPHILPAEMEEILTKMNSLGSSFEKVYDDITVNILNTRK